jgi:membrane-bound serine protease (ClpP class)
MAGSAGTLITLAGHVAAMAPETVIGAASPVGGQGEDLGETMEAKAKEATMALARSLAERRGPQAVQLAEDTIERATAVTAEEARRAGLIELVANDIPDLMRQLDERTVEVNGQARTLLTSGLIVDEVPLTAVETVLNLLVDPNLVSILFSLGMLMIIIEIRTPGGWVLGVLGGACLLLAFYGLGALPVNWFGVIFIVLAFVLLVAEIATPATFGALTVAGGISLVIGLLVLFNSPGSLPFFRVNVPLVVGLAVTLSGLSLAVLIYALRTMRRPVITGTQTLIGQAGVMRTTDSAQVAGELWTVEPDSGPLTIGDQIEVLAIKGLKLLVRKK